MIADDLTGANDTGVQFARRGARTLVSLDWRDLTDLGPADVLVLNTGSRALSAHAAARRVLAAARALAQAGVKMVFKKIDSTARGNIGTELDAVLRVFPAPLAVLTPAFPPAGRAVRDGRLLVHGVPVHETAIGADPVTPVRESHLPTLLAAQLRRRRVHGLPLTTVRGPRPALDAVIAGWRGRASAAVVADAETAADLTRLARLILRHGFSVCAGSAGLGFALSARLRWPGGRARPPRRSVAPVLLVVGSRNPVSLDQVAQVERRGVAVVRADVGAVLDGGARARGELDRLAATAVDALAAGQDVVLALDPSEPPHPSPTASTRLSALLARAAARVMAVQRPSGLVLSGGDIAVAVSRALGAHGFEVIDEVEPGLPWARLVGGDFAGLPTATKAGGFGTPNAFVAAAAFLRGDRRRR